MKTQPSAEHKKASKTESNERKKYHILFWRFECQKVCHGEKQIDTNWLTMENNKIHAKCAKWTLTHRRKKTLTHRDTEKIKMKEKKICEPHTRITFTQTSWMVIVSFVQYIKKIEQNNCQRANDCVASRSVDRRDWLSQNKRQNEKRKTNTICNKRAYKQILWDCTRRTQRKLFSQPDQCRAYSGCSHCGMLCIV